MISTEDLYVATKLECYHCGEKCSDNSIRINDKVFCCNGCKTVYEILKQNNLCDYYSIDESPGLTQKKDIKRNYEFLEDSQLKESLIDFTDGKITKVTFSIPQMHCSSCIWILENLFKFNPGIISSKVDFLKKVISIQFLENQISLKQLVELLDSIGYEPDLNLQGKNNEKQDLVNRKLYYRIGVAGFCFGNIMLLSFPDYLSFTDVVTKNLQSIFSVVIVLLSLPVFFFSANEYFISAYKGLRKKIVNIDVPVSLGISVLFFRSMYEIFSNTGVGYLDSMSALVFLLLVGKVFQNKTYDAMNFERNYKSYFPIAVTLLKNGIESTKPVGKLNVGERIIVKNNELIPADSVLINGSGFIDYSFVTGESNPVERLNGDMIYAGGRQTGSAIEVETIKEVSQSYLTRLWNNKVFDQQSESKIGSIVNIVSKYFTFIILTVAISAAIYWYPIMGLVFNAFTAVLIIACPCALALSTPFTLGNSLRIFGRNKFYLKNTNVVEKLSGITDIVFDKTGTITESTITKVEFAGSPLKDYEKKLVKTLVHSSSHPLSRHIDKLYDTLTLNDISNFNEIPGKGIEALIDGIKIKIGSKKFAAPIDEHNEFEQGSKVYLSINNDLRGFYTVANEYREGLENVIADLSKNYSLSVLSGDNDSEKDALAEIFPQQTEMIFRQSPHDKLHYIEKLKKQNKSVLMIGDGLNDAGALKQSDVGISISEDINNFSPSCDGILDARSFTWLKKFLNFSKTSKNIIIISFIISFIYNFIGLSFAVQGTLSPVIAAILMPLSSISVVIFTTLTTTAIAKKRGLL